MSFDIPERTRVVGLGMTVALVVSAVAGGLALGAVDLTAPTEDASTAQGASMASVQDAPMVRFVHAVPDGLPVNVTIDGQQMYTNVSFGTVTDYVWVASGTHTVTVTVARPGPDDEVLVETELDVQEGSQYTVAAGGEWTADSQRAVVVEDNLTVPDNESRLRLTHLSPDAPAVDVVVNGTGRVLFDDVAYLNSSNYVSLPAGNHTLDIRRAAENNSGPVLATVDVSLNGSTSYSAFAIGYANPEAAIVDTPFDVVVAGPDTAEPGPNTSITPTPVGTPVGTETPTGTEDNETEG